MTATRRISREKAMQALYAYEISQEPIVMLIETIIAPELETDTDSFKFAQEITYKVLNHRVALDALIKQHCHNWDFERIAVIDRVLLRMGITEFLYFPEIPIKVTINECVSVAQRFSTEDSGRFINAILDAVCTTLKEQGKLDKEGRGLIEA